jgi:signal transduction histidine kinase/ActR/RegA family two-component response regulator
MAFCRQATRDKRDHEFEYRMIAADGGTVWLRDLVTVVVENDQPVKLRGVMVDVTERKRADEALQKLNEKLEQQVTDRTAVLVAKQQELRSLAAELCRTEERERKRLATELHDNLAQLLALCNMKLGTVQQELKANGSCKALDEAKGVLGEALTYTRTLMTDLRPVLLGDQEDLSAAIFWVTEKMRRHGLIVEVQDDGEQKWLDEEILTVTYQSIQELLFNVLKHGKTTKAALSLRCSGGFLEAVVRDEGTGFDVSTSRTPSAEGAFGLFSIRERLDLLGGRFEISSVPGAGTCAKVVVPLKTGTSSSHPTLEPQDAPNGTTGPFDRSAEMVGSKTQVLLVDDHRIIREGLRSIIEGQADLEVVAEASDGEMALEATRATRPHVVIMDVNMPKMNGLEATRQIKAEFPNIMVVGLSMHDDAKIASGMRDAGASAYLSKGKSFETLCATIRSVRAKHCEI